VDSRVYQTKVYPFLSQYVVWIPEQEILVRGVDDCYIEHEPLYPGYIFIGLNPNQNPYELEKLCRKNYASFHLLRSAKGEYYEMPLHEIGPISAHSPATIKDAGLFRFRKGDKVVIKAGPLAGCDAVVKSISRNNIVLRTEAFDKDLELVVKKDSFVFIEPYAGNKNI
jgi:transcription antitermination factor NusG